MVAGAEWIVVCADGVVTAVVYGFDGCCLGVLPNVQVCREMSTCSVMKLSHAVQML